MNTLLPRLAATVLVLCLALPHAVAGVAADDAAPDAAPESPWLFTPILSADPKLGSSIGAMGARLHQFDAESPTSMFGGMGSWSDTDSTVAALFARSYFQADQQRLSLFAMRGEVNNNYADFLGSGYPLKSTDIVSVLAGQYLWRTHEHLYLGVQAVDADYAVFADTEIAQGALDLLGLNGFRSTGAGFVLQFDDRDNQESPTRGSSVRFNNLLYRESLGGEVDFDTWNLDVRHFRPHDGGKVLGLHFDGRWTTDAPPSGYSSVRLRGYTMGQYLAPNALLFEAEERIPLRGRIGAQVFVGAACLYAGSLDCDESHQWYPAAGGGLNFLLKQKEGMVIRLDAAIGKDDNRAVYLKFGQAF